MNTKDKIIIQKLAKVVAQQQKIIEKLAQQVIDTTKTPSTDPLGKFVHDVTAAWATKNGISAGSRFSAGADGNHYDVDVELNITDPRKTSSMVEKAKGNFLVTLQNMFDRVSKDTTSPLSGCTATFNVSVK